MYFFKKINKPHFFLFLFTAIYLLAILNFPKESILKYRMFLDYMFNIIILVSIIDFFLSVIRSDYRAKENLSDLFFILIVILTAIFFAIFKKSLTLDISLVILIILLVRNITMIGKSLKQDDESIKEAKSNHSFSGNILIQPAKTILVSYLFLIMFGTLLLSLPIATTNPNPIKLIDAIFTITSAVSVTGLAVLDTAKDFTLFGQIVILIWIQVGGLGIMIFSYLTGFALRRKVSIENKLTFSYAFSEEDLKSVSKTVRNIIVITMAIEGIGIFFLTIHFSSIFGFSIKSIYHAIFHSISAFCNAGFSTFSDGLIRFKSNVILNLTIVFLVVSGGFGFFVITNLYENLKNIIRTKILNKKAIYKHISLNTIIVVVMTLSLIFIGMVVFYALEHKNVLLKENLLTQYLQTLFQSVIVRTAGFNTVDLSALRVPTYLMLILLMLIGGGSVSTAGGIKVNSIATLIAYVRSMIIGKDDVVILNKLIDKEIVIKAMLITISYVFLAFLSTFLLSITENFSYIHVLFESVSALATVGVSAGITPHLSIAGKIIVSVLMFIGKLGPLTMLLAISKQETSLNIKYPRAEIYL